jgi:hypothetical protein
MLSACTTDSRKKISGKKIIYAEPKQINWIGHWKKEGYKEKLLYDIKRQFEFENQDISLNLIFPEDLYPGKSDNEFFSEEIIKSVTEWDIIRINNHNIAAGSLANDPEWAKKYLVDFSQYEKFNQNSIDDVISSESKERWGGIIPGHAIDANNLVLWCNKDLADKIGITPKPFEMTAEDFDSYLKALHDYNIKNNKTVYGLNINNGWLPASGIAFQLFSSIIGDYGKIRDLKYSEEKLQAWEQVLNYFEKISSYKVIYTDWNKVGWGYYNEKIIKDECLFMVNSTWMYNLLEGIDKENYKKVIPLELPGFKHNQTYAGDHSFPWAVPKNAKNREEAVRFLLYWCQPSIADEWVRNTKSPTGIKGSMVQTGFGVDVYENFDYTINNKYKGKKLPVNLHNNGRFFGIKNKDIPNYFVEVITGSVTSREAMRLIRSRLVRS